MGAWMETWLSFFFGSPRRFMWTLAGVVVVVVLAVPSALTAVADRLALAVANAVGAVLGRLAEPALTILLFAFGFMILWRAISGGGKKKRRR